MKIRRFLGLPFLVCFFLSSMTGQGYCMNDSEQDLFDLLRKCPTLRAKSSKYPEKDFISGQDVVIYFGTNNIGKSVGINMMLGTDLEIAPGMGGMHGEETVVKRNQEDDGPEIGNRKNPKEPTRNLTCYRRQGDPYSHCDMPGAESNLSLYDWVATACQVKHTFDNARTVRFVYAADPSGFTGAELLNTVGRANKVFTGGNAKFMPFPVFATRFGYRSSEEMEKNMVSALENGQFKSFKKLGFPIEDIMLAPKASIFGSSGTYFPGVEEERKRNIGILKRAVGLKKGELKLDFEEWMDGESKGKLQKFIAKIIARHLLNRVDHYVTEKHLRDKRVVTLRDLLEEATKELDGKEDRGLEGIRFLYPESTGRAVTAFVKKAAEHFNGRHDKFLEELRNKDILYGRSFYHATDRLGVSPLSCYLYGSTVRRFRLPEWCQSDLAAWGASSITSGCYNQPQVRGFLEFSCFYKLGQCLTRWLSDTPVQRGLQFLCPDLVWQDTAEEKFSSMRNDLKGYFDGIVRSRISN